jgi:hypothetical protein
MAGKIKKCSNVYPFAAENRVSNDMTQHHPNGFKVCGSESYWGSYKPTEKCSNQATNSRKKRGTLSFVSRNSRC